MSYARIAGPSAGFDNATVTPLQGALGACRKQFILVGVFSGVVNLLQLTTSVYMMQVFDRVLASRILDTLYFLSLIAIVATLVLALLEAVRGQVMQRLATWVEHRVAPEGFVRAIESTLRGRPYRMEALRDLAVCRGFLSSAGAFSLYDVPWVPIYLAFIFMLHPVMGCIALGGAVILFSLTLVSELSTSKLLKAANSASMASQRRADSISRNAEVIDSMGMLPAVIGHWRKSVAAMTEPQQRAADRASILIAATKFFRSAVQIGILGVGAYLVLQQELTSGASIAGSIIMGRALAPVEQLIGGWKQLVQARQSYRRLQAFLTQPRLRPAGMPLPEPTGRLMVEHVSYAFPGQGVALIKGVNFALSPGESLAVIGPSAAGKTTLIRLLIGTLPASPATVHEAAKLAGCHEMILRLPNGYDTQIGDGGQHLSGGQRQLVGLARAMFGKPKLIVLDEPNSNLDGDSEAALTTALERLKEQGTTVILVSHRPTLVQGVDKVLLLKDGALEMFGPRAEVLKRLMNPRPTEVAPPPPTQRLEGSAA